MRIRIKSAGHNFEFLLPTNLIFSPATAWLANTVGRRYAPESLADIPPEALNALMREFRRIKQKHGKWELADVESADGQRVQIVL